MTTDDMTLLQQWRAGDRQAGDALIRRHYDYAYSIARRRLHQDDAAAEATQHAMVVVVQNRDTIETNFRAYLGKAVFYSVLSQTKHRRHEPLEGNEPSPTPQPGASSVLAEREAKGEEQKLLVKALRSLSLDDQLLFYYDFVSEASRTELAEVLGIERHKIHAHVHRAKQRLLRRLEGFRDSLVKQSTIGDLDGWLESLHAEAPTLPAKPKGE
jgi:RNA polymerase sigma factor (sigma-70 family)